MPIVLVEPVEVRVLSRAFPDFAESQLAATTDFRQHPGNSRSGREVYGIVSVARQFAFRREGSHLPRKEPLGSRRCDRPDPQRGEWRGGRGLGSIR
jgi:hypothetical protein